MARGLGGSGALGFGSSFFATNASVLGGSTTLIGTSTNLIVAGLVFSTYGVNLSVFFPTAVGLPAAIAGVAHYWWLVKADTRPPRHYAIVIGLLLAARLWAVVRSRTGKRFTAQSH